MHEEYWSEQSSRIGPMTIRSVETGSPYGAFGIDGLFHDEELLYLDEIILF